MKLFFPFSVVFFLSSCSSGPVPPDWQLNSYAALNAYRGHYLKGDTRAADAEFARLKNELAATGRPSLIARAELIRCALRAASLEFDGCPGFESLRADAGAEEIAYADFLSGRTGKSESETLLARLVAYGVKFRTGKINPGEINAAVDLSSAQGWRRPLLAWLGVQLKRTEAVGDRTATERIKRRIDVILRANRS